MNNTANECQASKAPSKGLWWSLTIIALLVLLPAVVSVTTYTTSGSMARKTKTIIDSIRLGLELTLGSKAQMIPLDFNYLREHFGHLDTLAELRALQAIDESRHCFVDAWGRPLTIRLGPHQQFEVISSGPDGLPGTSDDLR